MNIRLTLILISFCHLVAAQQVQLRKISGKLTNVQHRPLPNIRVEVYGTQVSVVSDKEGRFVVNIPKDIPTLLSVQDNNKVYLVKAMPQDRFLSIQLDKKAENLSAKYLTEWKKNRFIREMPEVEISMPGSSPTVAGEKAHPGAFSPNELDQIPEFPGGLSAWNQYISDNLKYPESARDNGVEGRVFLSVVVEEDGSLSDAQIIRSLSPECSAEAIRLIKGSPKWISGKKGGKPVRASYNLAITFKL